MMVKQALVSEQDPSERWQSAAGSDVVATLDVVTGFGGNVLATRQVRRSDFSATNQWQTFTLRFDNPCFGMFEARVLWAGDLPPKTAQDDI